MDLTTSPAKRQSGTASFTALTEEDELVPSLWQKLNFSLTFVKRNMLLPNLKTNSWDKYSLDFVGADEYIAAHNVPAHGGLLCYRIRKITGSELWITVVVMNPLTRKWRRLIVPHQLQRRCDEMMWGLMVDRESGSYKVIGWEVRSVVCSMGELLWVTQGWDKDPLSDGVIYRLFKYNFKLEAWSMVTHLEEGQVRLVYNDVENRPVMGVDVFALSVNPPRVTRLPKIHDREILTYGTFAATLKAFV
ncbi:hypothetical protein R1sor_005533 [Riccia sorocarpa]|uniref:F-box associated domain-containing protein n=1 Tax=Riccia sorocarpa TaxID=122646 RepID=A0ABD3HMU1_9MARC